MPKIIPKTVYMRKIAIAKQMRDQRQSEPISGGVRPSGHFRCNCSHYPAFCFFHSKAGA